MPTSRIPPIRQLPLEERLYSFEGREARSGYFKILVAWILYYLLVTALMATSIRIVENALLLALILTGLALLAPMVLTATCRRCHDVGWSGWMMLTLIIPFIGIVFVLYLLGKPGDEKANRFGYPPNGQKAWKET